MYSNTVLPTLFFYQKIVSYCKDVPLSKQWKRYTWVTSVSSEAVTPEALYIYIYTEEILTWSHQSTAPNPFLITRWINLSYIVYTICVCVCRVEYLARPYTDVRGDITNQATTFLSVDEDNEDSLGSGSSGHSNSSITKLKSILWECWMKHKLNVKGIKICKSGFRLHKRVLIAW